MRDGATRMFFRSQRSPDINSGAASSARSRIRVNSCPFVVGNRVMLLVVVLAQAGQGIPAQAAKPATTTNHVLDLDGDGSYVELPSNIFTNLTAATVEGWVKWRRLSGYSRFFEFGRQSNEAAVFTHDHSPDLRFNLYPANAPRQVLRVNGAVRTNEWLHIAAVSGPGGMKLYLNGQLAARTNYTGSFATITNDEHNLLGTGGWKNPTDEDFDGQM